jgi:phosphatidylserine/phosphatidylglycerophosphate/cardiolipin synthase-like enzyme
MTLKRKIFKNASASQNAVREVLALVFAQELLSPSQEVFIVAPWISNVVVFDNRLGQFTTVNPEWARREVRLIEVFVALATNGATVNLHTRPNPHNKQFKWRIEEGMSDAGVSDRLRWSDDDPYLHTKGLLTDRVFIDGSMNLTESGVALNDETVTISYEPADIAAARVHFESYGRR